MTELDEILAHLVEQVDGALAAAVSGMDGLLVEQYGHDDIDLAAAAAEITNVLAAGRNAMTRQLGDGGLQELVLGAQGRTGYVRLLGDDLFCLMLLGSEANLGKARLYTERAARKLAQVLA